jgi:hypothetical protein
LRFLSSAIVAAANPTADEPLPMLASVQRAEEIADVRDDGLRFFPGRDVTAAGVMPLLLSRIEPKAT